MSIAGVIIGTFCGFALGVIIMSALTVSSPYNLGKMSPPLSSDKEH